MPTRGCTLILVAGWAHGGAALAPLAEGLGGPPAVVLTSVGELYAEAQRAGEGIGRALAGRIRKVDGPVALVGWSAGGMVAIEAAAALPRRVTALVLLSTASRFCSDPPRIPGAAPAALRAMRGRIARAPEMVLRDFFSRAAAPQGLCEEALRERVATALAFGLDCLTHGLDDLRRADLDEAAKGLASPTLVMHGAEDRILPWPAGERLSRLIPECRCEILPDAGHLLVEQRSKLVGRTIREFLEGES